MKLRRFCASLLCALSLTAFAAMSASAAENGTDVPGSTATATAVKPGDTADPCSDVIETKFRYTTDHRVQYRRWNATHGYWVDPHWIDLP